MFTNTDQLGFGPTDWHAPSSRYNSEGASPTHYTLSAVAGIATGLLGWYGVRGLKGGTVPAATAAILGALVGYTAASSWGHPFDTWQNRRQMHLTNEALWKQAR